MENAYDQLVAEGYIYSMPKRGFYVTDFKKAIEIEKKNITKDMVPLTSGDSGYLADFSSNQTQSELFPFTIWKKMVREVLNENQMQLMTNPPCGGILYLREAIATYLKEFRGMTVLPEQIIIGAGTEYLYGLLIQLFGKDKIYAVENPGYRKIPQIYKSHQVQCEYINMDDDGVNVSELEEKKADILHITPSHHYPTGIVMPISRRYELLSWASKGENRYIIEDDYDSELRLSGQPIPTLQSIDVSDKVIYMNTFTKTFSSTVRISYMVLPGHLLDQFYKKLSFYSCTVSNFEQYTLAKFIQEGYFEKHINRMRIRYKQKKDLILKEMKRCGLLKLAKIDAEDAGLHFLLRVCGPVPAEKITRRAAENGVRVTGLSAYYHTAPVNPQTAFVISYSEIPDACITEAVNRLAKAVTAAVMGER